MVQIVSVWMVVVFLILTPFSIAIIVEGFQKARRREWKDALFLIGYGFLVIFTTGVFALIAATGRIKE